MRRVTTSQIIVPYIKTPKYSPSNIFKPKLYVGTKP